MWVRTVCSGSMCTAAASAASAAVINSLLTHNAKETLLWIYNPSRVRRMSVWSLFWMMYICSLGAQLLLWKWRVHLWWKLFSDLSLPQAANQCWGWHITLKWRLGRMGIPFDIGLYGASGPRPLFSAAGSTDGFMEGWDGVRLFLLPSFSPVSRRLSSGVYPLHPCCLTRWASACNCSSLLSPWIHE